jgi:uncharacterized protein YgbK (DUF1537 family)
MHDTVNRSLELAAIADDITGGVELASMLVSRGLRVGFALGVDGPMDPAADAQVVALKIRTAERDWAVDQTRAALGRLLERNPRHVFFKYCATFDSTPKGNIGPCAEAILAQLADDFTVFCPAFIEAGRTVYQGHLFVGEQLLAESPKRNDPVTPMTDSNLLRILQSQSLGKVGLVPLATIRRGASAVAERITALRHQGVSLAIVDAVEASDVAVLAEASLDLKLTTGNSSIAADVVSAARRARGVASHAVGRDAALPGIEGAAVVLAGSCAERTEEQLREFEGHRPVRRIDVDAACRGEDVVTPALAWSKMHLAEGPVAVATTMPPDGVAALHARYGIARVSATAETILARLSRHFVNECGVRRILVAGGETSGAILQALDVTSLNVGPYEQPGLSRSVALGREPLALVLKSGKLGPRDMFFPALEALRRPVEIELQNAC